MSSLTPPDTPPSFSEKEEMFSNNTGTLVSISLAGIFGFSSSLLTFLLIYRHLKHWTQPEGQTYIVRILFMVPVYSLSSFFSLLDPENTIYYNLVRDCFEAYVLYQFFSLLVYYFDTVMREEQEEVLLDDDAATGDYLALLPIQYHPFPCCCLPIIYPGHGFLKTVKRGILQYVFVKPVMALIAIILQLVGLYDEGSTNYRRGYPWITLIINLSITVALYHLLLFYTTIEKTIEKQYQPLYKLLAIKILIFFIFWQTLLIDALYYFDMIPNFLAVAGHDILNNSLVCGEMFFLSLANFIVFRYTSFRSDDGSLYNQPRLILTALTTRILNPGDLLSDAKEVFVPSLNFPTK